MRGIGRRGLLKATIAGLAAPTVARGAAPRVVVVGGGAGGATLARLLREAPAIAVTLIEANPSYTTCFYSNLVVGGLRSMASITHGYGRLIEDHGVEVVRARAVGVDADAQTVALDGGGRVAYDRLVLSPGIDLRFDAIEGYDAAATEAMPHAYRAGPQTKALARRIGAMRAGGTFLIVAPPNPYRCPPAPYERACMAARVFKKRNPTAKIVILDAKDEFTKQPLFEEAWLTHYPGMIEWVPGTFGGAVTRVDPRAMSVANADGETFAADVINLIPPQRAGTIARAAGVAEAGGWCPIDGATMASTLVSNVHVLGDSSLAGDMPKSAYTANSQAKVCAAAIRRELLGAPSFEPFYHNTCWSRLAAADTVMVGANYAVEDGAIVKTDGFVSAVGERAKARARTGAEADGWYQAITAEMFG